MSSEIAVVIPCLNGAATIAAQLDALVSQELAPAEVIVADNGSTDATAEIVQQWQQRLPIRVVDASDRPGSAHARNVGVDATTAARVAFCDADDVAAPEWLAALDLVLDNYDLVGGRLDGSLLNDDVIAGWRPPRSIESLSVPEGFLAFAPSGNMAIHRAVWQKLGGMNEDYQRSHDVEFSWRAQMAGHSLGYAPDALLHYRYRSTSAGAFRQGVQSGRAMAQLFVDFGPGGLRGRGFGQTVRDWSWLAARAPLLARPSTRGVWARRSGQAVGRASGSIAFRCVYL